jgi:hypothetical protein
MRSGNREAILKYYKRSYEKKTKRKNHGEEGVGGGRNRSLVCFIHPSSNWLATSELACQHIIRLAPSLSCWWRSSAVAIKDARARNLEGQVDSLEVH